MAGLWSFYHSFLGWSQLLGFLLVKARAWMEADGFRLDVVLGCRRAVDSGV